VAWIIIGRYITDKWVSSDTERRERCVMKHRTDRTGLKFQLGVSQFELCSE